MTLGSACDFYACMQIGEAMRQMAADRLSRADSSSPLRVIGIVDEGHYICSGSNSASGLQLLREAVQNRGCSSRIMTAANAEAVAQISALAAQLPSLQVLELTHHPHLVIDGIRDAMQGSVSGELSSCLMQESLMYLSPEWSCSRQCTVT